ncbi:hypothetical protein [Streptomyces cyanogenus]|uniref:Thiopeptide-type bacteriocin biosynthesis domain-containing protein n=1 Tax=Streptomyces cyanogenus TaxID=80860 RepID=A0ABX7TKA5_STRCY|nr:hypothetical protein [Streptomyces cyanogenus]QTD95911.1 hypothetical protein S1361_01070 [Streptomyces cyanogenus]
MPELPELVRVLRAADGIWFFDPAEDSPGPAFALWCRTAPERREEIRTALRAEGAVRIVEERHGERPVVHRGARGFDLSDELAAVSSELAVALTAEGGPADQEALVWAVRHLQHVVGLVPQRDRRAFLFACWQQWSAGLAPEDRVSLGLQAEIEAESVTGQAAAGPRRGPAVSWTRYTERTRAIAADPAFTAQAPGNYLLFRHAHRTHARMGLPLAVEALAARIVRAELDATGAPAAPSLQNA